MKIFTYSDARQKFSSGEEMEEYFRFDLKKLPSLRLILKE